MGAEFFSVPDFFWFLGAEPVRCAAAAVRKMLLLHKVWSGYQGFLEAMVGIMRERDFLGRGGMESYGKPGGVFLDL